MTRNSHWKHGKAGQAPEPVPFSAALAALVLVFGSIGAPVSAADIWIGGATVDITPSEPVALSGQRNVRISKKAETPISATALALESRDGDRSLDQAVIVSCDLVAIRPGILDMVRGKVKATLPEFDVTKLFLCATHTHTAPVMMEGRYTLPETGIMQPAEYAEFLTARVADAVVESWQKRKAGRVGWGQGQAVVAQNRRAFYANGTAAMYGATDRPDFRGIEGYEDHNLDVLFFWDDQEQLIATAVNVPCPSQEVGSGSSIHADFWDPVRRMLRERHGEHLLVLGLTGASGDHTSRLMYGRAADERMRRLRGLTRLEEIARRIVVGWEDAYDGARRDIRSEAELQHLVQVIELPYRQVTEAEVAEARREAAKYADNPAQTWNYRWNQGVVERYESQQAGTAGVSTMELHVLRLGDVAICTNEFELFADYGVQIKARSPAVQTFVIQLTGSAGYLPTERAVRGGGYSAVIQSSRIGPQGGQVLVDRTVDAIHTLWPKP
jgi:hypothetical protein